MTYVVTRLCVGCKDTSCVTPCPTEAFHEGPDRLYINPESCVVCDACVVECPVDAIFHTDDVPAQYSADIELNQRMSQILPVISESKRPS